MIEVSVIAIFVIGGFWSCLMIIAGRLLQQHYDKQS